MPQKIISLTNTLDLNGKFEEALKCLVEDIIMNL